MTAPRDYRQSILDGIHHPLLVLDPNVCVAAANQTFYRAFGLTSPFVLGKSLYALSDGAWNLLALRRLLEDCLTQDRGFDSFEVDHDLPGRGHRVLLLSAHKIDAPERPGEVLLTIAEVTEQRANDARQRADGERLQQAYDQLAVAGARERKIAEALQQPLTLEIAEDTFTGLSVATLFEAASLEAEVGGDFFDAFLLPDGRIALAVADTAGKGLVAAARTLQIKEVLRAFARESPSSATEVVARLNRFACDNQPPDRPENEVFTCLVLAFLNPRTGEGEMVSAGCEPPLILRAEGRSEVEYFPLGNACLPLGITPREVYTVVPFHLDPGDILILMTDGITEAHPPRTSSQTAAQEGHTFLGSEGALALAKQAHDARTLRDRGTRMLQGARTFAGGALHDDACLLLAQRTGRSTAA